MFIGRLKQKFNVDEPIFTNEILELFSEFTRAYVFRLINKEKEIGELVQFDKGVYYLPQMTIFGLSTITADDVIKKKYLQNGKEVYGVYSGLKLQNIFSVITQMPNTVEIVTNNETMRCRQIELDGRRFVLRRSRCPISKANANAYTILQLFTDLGTHIQLDRWAKERVVSYIRKNNISIQELVKLASVFPAQTTKNLIINGVLNEIA